VLVSESLIYDYEPEKKTLYDYKRSNLNHVYDTREYERNLIGNERIKDDICTLYIKMENSILKAEIKVVTIIDLLT